MSYSLFQKLSENELDNYLSDIDLALEFHIKWLSEVNRALVCRIESNQSKLIENDNHFSRWYSNVTEEELVTMDAFVRLGEIHEDMIVVSNNLLLNSKPERAVICNEYDEFLQLSNDLRTQIHILKNKIKSDLKLIATIMGKVFENAEEGVMITDSESHILNVNQAFINVTQYSREEVIGLKPSVLHSGNHDQGFYERMWNVILKEHRWQGEIWNRRKNSEIYPEWLSITAVFDDNDIVSHYIGIFSDVSTESEGDERLYHLAHYDSLCDLPNRMLFYDRLRQAISRSKRSDQRIAVMFMDLDGFKNINDDYGHGVGDELLQQVSKRIISMLRETDTIARIGGDEFTFIINDIGDIDSINAIAEKVLTIVQEPYSLHGNAFNISASIGISLCPDNSEDLNLLVKQADIAMYKAKKEGKNRYEYYDTSMG